MPLTDPHFTLTATFRRASFPFWEGVSADAPFLAERGRGRKSIVAVYNRGTGDIRLKLWITDTLLSLAIGEDLRVSLNGEIVELADQENGFFQGRIPAAEMRRILDGPPLDLSAADENYEPGPYRDACVETVFAPGSRVYHAWQADVSEFPRWLRAKSISITPTHPGGGPWGATLRTDIPEHRAADVQMLRVNGVWGQATPVIDHYDASGQGEFRGTFQVSFDPDMIEEIRQYGHGELAAPPLDDAPIPPRSQAALARLREIAHIPPVDYLTWRRDIRALRTSLIGLVYGAGQADVHNRILRTYAGQLRYAERGIARAEAAANPPTDPADIAEAREKATYWRAKLSGQQQRVADLETKLDKSREAYDAALARCETREAAYADAIPAMYPDEAV